MSFYWLCWCIFFWTIITLNYTNYKKTFRVSTQSFNLFYENFKVNGGSSLQCCSFLIYIFVVLQNGRNVIKQKKKTIICNQWHYIYYLQNETSVCLIQFTRPNVHWCWPRWNGKRPILGKFHYSDHFSIESHFKLTLIFVQRPTLMKWFHLKWSYVIEMEQINARNFVCFILFRIKFVNNKEMVEHWPDTIVKLPHLI